MLGNNKGLFRSILTASLIFLIGPVYSQAQICSTGTGLPPFLDAGANPNLLLALDNSGSMLDVAYVNDGDPTLPEFENGETNCFDDTYLRNDTYTNGQFGFEYDIEYVGYFGAEHNDERDIDRPRDPQRDPWYIWVEGTNPITDSDWRGWESNFSYSHGDIILDNGMFYRAVCDDEISCSSSNVSNIEEDTDSNVTWGRPDGVEPYASGQLYGPGTTRFVRYKDFLYYTATATDAYSVGATPPDDSSLNWVAVEYTWLPGTAYVSGDIVSYEGTYYRASESFTSSSTNLFDDRNTSSDILRWQRLDEGSWQEWLVPVDSTPDDFTDDIKPCDSIPSGNAPSFSNSYDYLRPVYDENGEPVTPQPDTVTDVQITLLDADGDPIYAGNDFGDNPAASVECFAARANFLNWATASKFDIQKMILTGGKYDAGYEAMAAGERDNTVTDDDVDDRLVAENRGCAGSAFVKQITLDTTNDIKLTLRVRGSGGDDWVDTFDDTTRLDILSVQTSGFDITGCQGAVDEALRIQSGETSGGGQFKKEVDSCLTSNFPDKDTVNPALNHALQYCWFGWREGAKTVNRDLNTIIGDCQVTYEDRVPNPDDILVSSDAYNCYGTYDDGFSHTDRNGYIGRCWDLGESTGVRSCDYHPTSEAPSVCNPNNCEWWPSGTTGTGDLLRISGASPYIEYCTQFDKNNNCKNNNKWDTWYTDSDIIPPSDPKCDPTDALYVDTGSAGFSDLLIPGTPPCKDPSCTPEFDPEVPIKDNKVSEAAWWCIFQAMEDYCDWLQVPQAIDPSDKANITGDLVNMPAQLIDAGVLIQLGVDKPLKVYKGYVKYELPAQQKTDDPVRPDGPRRVLYNASNLYDIRIGVMAFNDVGSDIECDTVDIGGNIEPYCDPPAGNRDGASIIAQVKRGKIFDAAANGAENWDHHNDLIDRINDVKATSWTPLAEAFYVALGYLGQDPNKRLFDPSDVNLTDGLKSNDYPDFYTAVETPVNGDNPWDDPVQYWCQENHILIITEGASTADIHPDVAALAVANPDADNNDRQCTGELYGSTYLDDLTYMGRDGIPNYQGADLIPDEPRDATDIPIEANIGDPGIDLLGTGGLFKKLLPTGDIDIDAGTEVYAKQPIYTHIVTTGSLRGATAGGTEECSPVNLMENSANNGGTTLLYGEKPREVENKLEETLRNIAQRVSTGSAASVIASSRSGEGAVYQAVFWPEIPRTNNQDPLTWTGDVHSLFIDELGRMWDDYDGNGIRSSDDINGDGLLNTEDLNGNNILDEEVDLDGDGIVDPVEETIVVNGVFDTEDINGNGVLDFEATGTCLTGDRRLFYDFDGENTYVCFNADCVTVAGCEARTTPVKLEDFNDYIWSASEQLRIIDSIDILVNREVSPPVEPESFAGKWNWDLSDPKRYIFTWNDLNNNGIVDEAGGLNEIIELESEDEDGNATDWTAYGPVPGTGGTSPTSTSFIHHSILDDFQMSTSLEFNQFINWLRGVDELFEVDDNGDGVADPVEDLNNDGFLADGYVYRCRRLADCLTDPADWTTVAPENIERRLGDIIHSTPKLVSQPAEAFQTIYRDPTYANFIERYRYRRSMIYFGANDGMLHAVNGGFYNVEGDEFALAMSRDAISGNPVYDNTAGSGISLGHEVWAYVPYNLQPHLKCLSDPDYGENHKYFVDKEPRIFDMKIFQEEPECKTANGYFKEECIHPKGWGTVLVGAMRFGGAPIVAGDNGWPETPDGSSTIASNGTVTDGAEDNRKFISSYFILDITDPERPPRLLAEMTMNTDTLSDGSPAHADLGFSTPMPAGVVMHDAEGGVPRYFWYLLFGNGPVTLKGQNNQQGKIGVLPMSWLDGRFASDGTLIPNTKKPFRIPNEAPASNDFHAGGRLLIPEYSVDHDDNPATAPVVRNESFTSDLITADLDLQTESSIFGGLYKSDAVYFGTTDGLDFGGSVSAPSWDGGGRVFRLVMRDILDDSLDPSDGFQRSTTPSEWEFKLLLDADGPVTGAPSLGWDGSSYWIYFGTGRFFTVEDKTDAQTRHFFGVKEPLEPDTCEMNWKEISWDSEAVWQTLNPNLLAGSKGLVRSDYIDVFEAEDLPANTDPILFCEDPPTNPTLAAAYGCDLSFLPDAPPSGDGFHFFKDLQSYIAGPGRDIARTTGECDFNEDLFDASNDIYPGVDGWYRVLQEPRERVIGQSTLLGGLITYSSYRPEDLCVPEGVSNLYGVHYQTGTAWYENVFGLEPGGGVYDTTSADIVSDKYVLGRGMATTPSLHVGTGGGPDAKAVIQTSTGEIIEIEQENLPLQPPKSGLILWSDRAK